MILAIGLRKMYGDYINGKINSEKENEKI